jgi:hypothetical protein
MPVDLDEALHPVVVLRTGPIDTDTDVDELLAAFERVFEIAPVGLVLEWGQVSRTARVRIAAFRETHDEQFVTAVRYTATVVAAAALEANRTRLRADPTRAARTWYTASIDDAVAWVSDRLGNPAPAP